MGREGGSPVVLDRVHAEGEHEVVDLADARAAEDAVRRVADRAGLRAVVTCAGTDACGRLNEVSAEAW